MDTWKQLKSTYRKAYHQIITEKPYEDEQKYKTFASCVAILCHDNVKYSLRDRLLYLSKLADLSGGPTVREHACINSAFAIGDAVKMEENGLICYALDERFPFPGTWDYQKAYNFSIPYIFGEIMPIHITMWLEERCFDDSPEDIQEIQRRLETSSDYQY
ncbi:hypothetical protein [Geminocystis herdmanii]|uniref:hypothetical protein n=1 Tax=Geminocystis herdmanii TaxID=669359 RepID=UPI00034846A3|nr:hypothetical protein [Geminocystis herdmanii]